jgi:hypothetical protein
VGARFDEKDPSSIVSYADKLEEFWEPRNSLMIRHQRMFKLDQMITAKPGHTVITENTPWWQVMLGTAVIAINQPVHRVPLTYGPGDTDQNDARSGQLERFIISEWRNVDKQMARSWHASYHWELSFYAMLRGWLAGLVAWDDQRAQSPYDIRLLDPFHVYPDPDIKDLVMRRYRRSLASVLDEYPKLENKLDRNTRTHCDCVDIYYKNRNAVIINGEYAKEWQEHELERPPLIVFPVGGIPVRSVSSKYETNESLVQLGDNSWVDWVGQGLLYPIYDSQVYSNKIASEIADTFSKYNDPTIVTYTESGQPIDVDVTEGATVGMKVGERIDTLRPSGMPGDLAAWLGRFSQMVERGGFPSVMLGATPHELSGFSRSVAHAGGAMRAQPQLAACKAFYEIADSLILEQLERYGQPGQRVLRGVDNKGKEFSQKTDMWELKSLVQGDYDVEVLLRPYMPQDEMANIQMAVQCRQYDVLSEKTILDMFFPDRVHDPAGEEQRILDQRVRNNPKALDLMSTIMAPVAVSRQLRAQLDRKRITPDEYDMAMRFLERETRLQTGAQEKALGQMEAELGPGMAPGPRGMPTEMGEFPMEQRPGVSQLPPEILAAQLQGSPSPPGGPEL